MTNFEYEGFVFQGDERAAVDRWISQTRGAIDFLSWCFDNLRQIEQDFTLVQSSVFDGFCP